MNKGIGRILIGLAFTALGGMRLANSSSEGLALFGGFMLLYGVFSIGHGIYMISKKPSPEMEVNDDVLEDEIT